MCGICGAMGIKDKNLIENMKEKLKHRGPDGNATYLDQDYDIMLGHVRLSILDLSDDGKQPMISTDNNYTISYNGEVYNYIEIRKELESLGYNFKSNTDTEVILNSYIEWGEKCLYKFNGMFSFAIWDRKKKELFCARDRLGIKPFYYFNNEDTFIFASEIKAILEHNDIAKCPNDKIIYDYLMYGYVEHTQETFFKNIYKLMPGHYIKIGLDNKTHITKYWDIDVNNSIESKYNTDKRVEEFKNLFLDSVKLRLRSDVTVGSCLSGGLDSSAIVCSVNGLLQDMDSDIQNVIGERQKIFSSCFDEKAFDEREYIEEVVARTTVEKNYIFPSSDDLVKEIKDLVYYQEEPFLSTSIFAQWSVMKRANEESVKVLLDGQGADEILCGYRKFRLYYAKELIKTNKYINGINEIIKGVMQINKSYNLKQDMIKILRILGFKPKFKYSDYIINEFVKEFDKRSFKSHLSISEAIYNDIRKYSLPALLRYEDKNSMAFSIESRVPFLDYRLVEYAVSLPMELKIKDGWSKWILREAMKDILPNKIRKRRDKMGFVTNEKQWLIEMRDYIYSIFENKNFKSGKFINQQKILEDFEEIINGKIEANIWRLINLELWMQCYFN